MSATMHLFSIHPARDVAGINAAFKAATAARRPFIAVLERKTYADVEVDVLPAGGTMLPALVDELVGLARAAQGASYSGGPGSFVVRGVVVAEAQALAAAIAEVLTASISTGSLLLDGRLPTLER